ncbi:hypothetical protein ACJX0J_009467, partial [Zea mays]
MMDMQRALRSPHLSLAAGNPHRCTDDTTYNRYFCIIVKTVRDEKEVLKAIEYVHELLDKEVATETSPIDILVCDLARASVLLYLKTLGSCAAFSGSVPLSKSFAQKVSSEARKTGIMVSWNGSTRTKTLPDQKALEMIFEKLQSINIVVDLAHMVGIHVAIKKTMGIMEEEGMVRKDIFTEQITICTRRARILQSNMFIHFFGIDFIGRV